MPRRARDFTPRFPSHVRERSRYSSRRRPTARRRRPSLLPEAMGPSQVRAHPPDCVRIEGKLPLRRTVVSSLEKVWDVESATGKGVLYVTRSKNETSKRQLPLNRSAREAVERMINLANALGYTSLDHYLWCASQHHKFDPTKPARKWDTAWHALRDAAGLPGFRFHDLRHTVVTDLLEAGEPEHVIRHCGVRTSWTS